MLNLVHGMPCSFSGGCYTISFSLTPFFILATGIAESRSTWVRSQSLFRLLDMGSFGHLCWHRMPCLKRRKVIPIVSSLSPFLTVRIGCQVQLSPCVMTSTVHQIFQEIFLMQEDLTPHKKQLVRTTRQPSDSGALPQI
jgi:hypothetical protein